MKTMIWLATGVFLVTGVAHAARQEPSVPSAAARALIDELRAGDWIRRRAAFEQLLKAPLVLTLAQRKEILTEVVARENDVIDQAFREGQGSSDKYGESYSEYAGRVADYLFSIVESADADALAAIALSPYHQDSVLARRLAAYGDVLVPTVVKLAASDLSPKRWQAFGLAGEMHRQNRRGTAKRPLDAAALQRLTGVLVAGTRDPDITTRQIAVRNLGVAGLTDVLPLLESIAQTDDGVATRHGSPQYLVRDEARSAIARIRSGQ